MGVQVLFLCDLFKNAKCNGKDVEIYINLKKILFWRKIHGDIYIQSESDVVYVIKDQYWKEKFEGIIWYYMDY